MENHSVKKEKIYMFMFLPEMYHFRCNQRKNVVE